MTPTITIRPVICANESGNGYLPGIVAGNLYNINTYAAVGYDRETAEAMARALAWEESKRYVGDWDVRVQTEVELIDIHEMGGR